MLVKFFRSSFLIQYFALICITAAIWIPGFLVSPDMPIEPRLITPLYNLAIYTLTWHGALSPAVSVLIIFISALAINNILIYHDLAPKNNILPAFIFILFMGSNPLILCTYPIIIALPFFSWFIHVILKINNEPENYMEVFNAGILASVISMIYPAALLLCLFIWLTLLIFGTFNGRNLVISFIALLFPYLYLFLYYFWTDQLIQALDGYRLFFAHAFSFQMNKNILQVVIWIVFVIFMLVPSFLRITSTLSSFNINFRKKMAVTVWLLVFSLPMIIFKGDVDYHTLIFLPATIMIAHYYNLFKKSLLNEIILFLFLSLVLINNYFHFFNA